jgi:hypothetical protein
MIISIPSAGLRQCVLASGHFQLAIVPHELALEEFLLIRADAEVMSTAFPSRFKFLPANPALSPSTISTRSPQTSNLSMSESWWGLGRRRIPGLRSNLPVCARRSCTLSLAGSPVHNGSRSRREPVCQCRTSRRRLPAVAPVATVSCRTHSFGAGGRPPGP